jgi:ferredoxin-nitrate reductase
MSPIKTTCCYCGVGCGIEIGKRRDGSLTLRGDPDHPTNRGALCSKGRTLLHVVANQQDRLLWPQVRQDRAVPLRRTTWDEAISQVAGGLQQIIAEHGPDAVALYVSGQCLTEEYYVANKLAKGFIGTNNIDTNSRLCMSSAVVGYKQTLGADSVPTCYEDLDHADTFFITGANPAWAHPIVFQRIERRKQAAPDRVRLICVDPRRTATAVASDLHLAIKPGTDVALYHGIAAWLRDHGHIDAAYIEAHCDGWAELSAELDRWPLARAAEVCDVPAADIAQAANWLSGDRRFLSLWTMGLNQSAVGVDKNVALINLSLITGKIGKPGCGPFSLTGQPNAMGGREVGGLANLLPAHRNLADPTHRAEVAKFWGVGELKEKPGLTATELIDAAERGTLKALWVMCTNPIASLPHSDRVAAALKKLDLVIVQDCFPTDTTPFAHVVLPAATWLEKTGSMTNSERRITLVEKAIEPPGEALADTEIICRVAKAMGFGHAFTWKDEAAVYREHVRLTAGTDCDITGLSHEIIRAKRSAQWPFPAGATSELPRLYGDARFATANQRAKLKAPPFADRSEPLDSQFPLVLTTGRLRDQWHTQTKTGRVGRLNAHAPVPQLELHPIDAEWRGIAEGDVVEIAGRRGTSTAIARVTTDLRPGVVFLPMHWGPRTAGEAGRSNATTSTLVDPLSKEPDLKFAAVQVARVAPASSRIVVIGAGSAALALTEHCLLYTSDAADDM